jgi:hypothetical protein
LACVADHVNFAWLLLFFLFGLRVHLAEAPTQGGALIVLRHQQTRVRTLIAFVAAFIVIDLAFDLLSEYEPDVPSEDI